jgi:hypothetical protein
VSVLLVVAVVLVPTGVTAAPCLLVVNIACFAIGLVVGCCCHRIRR